MIKNICFFSTSFAFNRFNRMKYYEKIFPKEIKMFLFTTDRYEGSSRVYAGKWDLKRTRVKQVKYRSLGVVKDLRRFCKENKIDTVINLGMANSAYVILLATLFSKTEFIVNIMNVFRPQSQSKFKEWLNFFTFYPLVLFSKRAIFVDYYDSKRVKKLLWKSKDIKFIPAPTDTKVFKVNSKKAARKKLGLPQNKKIVIFVGRLNYAKGTDLLMGLVKRNKEILFLAIGKAIYEPFKKFKAKNLIHFPNKTSEELVDYYNSADLGFFTQRLYGSGLGQTTQEAMACGVPSINRNWKGLIESSALFLIPIGQDFADNVLKDFFKKSKKEKDALRVTARKFIEKNYSGDTLKNKYLNYYLN